MLLSIFSFFLSLLPASQWSSWPLWRWSSSCCSSSSERESSLPSPSSKKPAGQSAGYLLHFCLTLHIVFYCDKKVTRPTQNSLISSVCCTSERRPVVLTAKLPWNISILSHELCGLSVCMTSVCNTPTLEILRLLVFMTHFVTVFFLFCFFAELLAMWCHRCSTRYWPLPSWPWWLLTGPSLLCIPLSLAHHAKQDYK